MYIIEELVCLHPPVDQWVPELTHPLETIFVNRIVDLDRVRSMGRVWARTAWSMGLGRIRISRLSIGMHYYKVADLKNQSMDPLF